MMGLCRSDESIVVFGHSLFFQQLMRKYFNDSYRYGTRTTSDYQVAFAPNVAQPWNHLEQICLMSLF
jgi:hypothetical protein